MPMVYNELSNEAEPPILWPLHLLFLGKNFSFSRKSDKGSRKTDWTENLLALASFQGPWQGSLDRKQDSSGDARALWFCDCSHMTLTAWCCSLLFAVRFLASLLFLPLLSDPSCSFMQVCAACWAHPSRLLPSLCPFLLTVSGWF